MAFNLKWFRTDSGVTNKYVSAGQVLGADINMRGYGEAVGTQKRIRRLVGWEQEHVRRGYRTISIADFTQAGGWSKDIADLVGVKREEGEAPIFHAQEYQENKKYVSAGTDLGFAISMLAYGEAVDMQKRIARLVGLEREYAGRGFQTISIDDFTQAGGWGEDIAKLVGVKREEGEKPIFHAQEYQENYITPPAWAGVAFAAFKTGEQQFGTNPNS